LEHLNLNVLGTVAVFIQTQISFTVFEGESASFKTCTVP